ncbi:MAG: cell envelope-related transcriptional attenuator [Frankiales bacterium]|nr:cell envelope-related transcriptional attenuator [Frankiales bacterium]
MAVVVLVAAGGLYLAVGHYSGQIARISGVFGLSGTRPPAAKGDSENFLLVGSDSRDGANGDKTNQGTGASFVTGQRSDTIILVHLFGNSDKAELISFPRDSYVEIPQYTNPKTHVTKPAHHTKLNSAFSEGGPALLVLTLEHLSNIRIDHYVQIDFSGFKSMVNKVGGVEVCLTKPAKDHFTGINLTAGHHHLDGATALAFVRQRHYLAQGDIDRIARQQQFIGSLVHKVLSAGTLLNPLKLNGFLKATTASLQADSGLKSDDIRSLALRFSHFSSGGVSFITVPIADSNARRGGASVVLLDDIKTAALFDDIRADRAPGTPAKPGKTSTTPLVVAPGAIKVSVFNGSGVNGLGRKAQKDIGGIGFQTIGVAQTRGTGASQTVIHFGPSKSDSARTLQAAIPGSVLAPDGNLGNTLELVVGSTYTGAQKVTVTKKPTAGGTTTATPPVQTAAANPCTS